MKEIHTETEFVWWRVHAFTDRKNPNGRAEIIPIMREFVNRMDDEQIVLLFSMMCSNSPYLREDFQEAVMPLLEEIYLDRLKKSPRLNKPWGEEVPF